MNKGLAACPPAVVSFIVRVVDPLGDILTSLHCLVVSPLLPCPLLWMTMISILIAEDDSLLRGLLRDVLAGQNDLKVIGTVATAEEALRAAREHRPEVLLLDL